MKKNLIPVIGLCCSIFSTLGLAQDREIAITIDDLPFVGTNSQEKGNLGRSQNRFMNILQALKDQQVPATGFVIAGSIGTGQWQLLEAFREAGFGLGNHTYTHANLNRMTSEKYIEEIAHADNVLAPLLTSPKYFRYPYLAEGKGEKKQEVQAYLQGQQYVVAPVTIDSKDYEFNERLLRISWRVREQHYNQMKQQYLNYIWKQTLRAEKNDHGKPSKQILLMHANLLNSLFLNDVIQMYKNNGYVFITLDDALAPQSKPETTNIVAQADAIKLPNDITATETPPTAHQTNLDAEMESYKPQAKSIFAPLTMYN